LSFFHILKRADIQADRSGSEFVDLFDSFGVTNHAPNCLTNMVCLQPGSFTNGLINLVVKLGRIPAILKSRYFQYLVASISKSPQSFIDLWSKLYRDYEFAFNRQGLSHVGILAHPTTDMETDGVLLAKLARSAYTISFPQ
jgi:hypothetical protein